jgi:hypothetical protein
MARKRWTAGLAKTTRNHCTYTDFAREGVAFLNGLAAVKKISPGIIVPNPKGRGDRSLRANRIEHGGLELKFSAAGMQVIFVIATDREAVIEALRVWSVKKGNCRFHERGDIG